MKCSHYIKDKNYKEKLWFAKRVDISSYDMIIEFNCGTGKTLSAIDKLLPINSETWLVGIDPDHLNDYPSLDHQNIFLDSIDGVNKNAIKENKILLILNSTLYKMNESDLCTIKSWCKKYATTIVCEDIFFPFSAFLFPKNGIQEQKVWNKLLNSQKEKIEQIRQLYIRKGEWFLPSASILYDFFFNYLYKEDWEAESNEIYFSNNSVDFLKFLSGYDVGRHNHLCCLSPFASFKITYYKTYIPYYEKKIIKKYFKYKMHYSTHIKFIVEKRRKNNG